MKKTGLRCALAASLLCTAVAGLAFFNNAVLLARWIRAFRAAGGDAGKMQEGVDGIIPWLNWSAVDYSCVSTFIPFFGLLLFTVALARCMAGKASCTEEYFIFPSYDRINVTLGLAGTLLGIILIGYYDMESVTMSSLMLCLHTALFSTLVAVVWVFLVVHPILSPLLGRILAREGLSANGAEDKTLHELVAELRTGASSVTDTVIKNGKALEELALSIGKTASGLALLGRTMEENAQRAKSRDEEAARRLDAALSGIETAFRAAAARMEAMAGDAAKETVRIAQEASKAAAISVSKELSAFDGASLKILSGLSENIEKSMRNAEEADLERRKRFDDALEERLAQTDRLFAERERLFSEMLEKRLKSLGAESEANAARAAGLEAKLAMVRSALE